MTLVICTFERPHCVVRLLEALQRCSGRPSEVIVVDASDDESAQRLTESLEAFPLEVRHLRVEDADRGLTRQRNVGIRAAREGTIAFLDDDCVPDPDYFSELYRALSTRDEAIGVGGWLDEGQWQEDGQSGESEEVDVQDALDLIERGGRLHYGRFSRNIGLRWRLRRRLGLAPALRPGIVPSGGHGWPVSYCPPAAPDQRVDCFMGGASLWRREHFQKLGFSPWFEGYGLYEDLDFCLRSRAHGALWLAPRAVVRHLHEPSARPRPFHYGQMVVVNGWRVWRQATKGGAARVSVSDRWQWWANTLLLTLVRTGNVITDRGGRRWQALAEVGGRVWGALRTLVRPPSLEGNGAPPLGSGGARVES